MVFDDAFSTVPSLASEDPVLSFWNDMDFDSHVYWVLFDSPEEAPSLSCKWLSPDKLEERHRWNIQTEEIRKTYASVTKPSSASPTPSSVEETTISPKPLKSTPTSPKSTKHSSSKQSSTQSKVVVISDNAPEVLGPPSVTPAQHSNPTPSSTPSPSALHRTSRTNDGQWTSDKHTPVAFLSSITYPSLSHHIQQLAYQVALDTDFDTGEDHCTDARAFLAKHKS